MDEIEVALNLLKMGKPLTALNFVKTFVKNNLNYMDLNSEECKAVVNIVLHFPSLNDESWRYFIHVDEQDVKTIIEKIRECLKV